MDTQQEEGVIALDKRLQNVLNSLSRCKIVRKTLCFNNLLYYIHDSNLII